MKGEALQIYNEILEVFPSRPSGYIKERVKTLIGDYAEELEVCPNCLSTLTTRTIGMPDEYQGFSCQRTYEEVICPQCGWEE